MLIIYMNLKSKTLFLTNVKKWNQSLAYYYIFLYKGQLLTSLRMQEHSTSNKEKTEMCLDVAKAMAYLHRNKVICR